MKILITENNLKTAIFKYFDLMKEKGKEPSVNKTLPKLFKTDEETLFGYLIDYLGGETNAIELTRSKLKQLPDRIKIIDSQFNGELYFSITDVAREIPEYEDHLPVEVDCYGDVYGVDVWNDDNEEYDYVEKISISDFYGQEDMTGGWEIKDIFVGDINSQLFEMVSRYTGIPLNVTFIAFIDG
jgi:uncharacterized protein YuzE